MKKVNIWLVLLIVPFLMGGGWGIREQVYPDTLTWDATKTDLAGYVAEGDTNYTDSTDVDGWKYLTDADTVGLLITVSDTIPLHNQIYARADSSLALYWPDTTVVLTNVKALIGARADSSTVIYWPDTVAYLRTHSDAAVPTAAPGSQGEVGWDNAKNALRGYGGALHVLTAENRPKRFTINNPKNLVGDTCQVWINDDGHTFTIDSIQAITRGSVDDFDFSLVEVVLSTGVPTLIEAMQVGTETANTYRADWFSSIDHGVIQDGAMMAIVTPSDSTNTLTISIHGRYTD